MWVDRQMLFVLGSYVFVCILKNGVCGCNFFFLSLHSHTPDDSLDPEDSDQRTHFPQFSYSASIREWSLRLLNMQAGLRTITIPHTHLHCWGVGMTQTTTGTKHIFIRSLTHILSHTQTHTHTHILANQRRCDHRIWIEHTGREWLTSAGLCG